MSQYPPTHTFKFFFFPSGDKLGAFVSSGTGEEKKRILGYDNVNAQLSQ